MDDLGSPALKNLVRPVTVGAYRGLFHALGDGAAVHALLVGEIRLGAVPAGLHHELLAVAGAASGGNVGMVDPRLGVAGRQQLVRAAVAVHAGGGALIAVLYGVGMIAAVVGRLLFGVAGGADDLGWSVFVRRGFDVGVAIDAREHAAVHRILELVGVNVQADRLAVDVLGEAGVAVASQAVVVSRLLCRSRRSSPAQEQEAQPKAGSTPHRSRVHLALASWRM